MLRFGVGRAVGQLWPSGTGKDPDPPSRRQKPFSSTHLDITQTRLLRVKRYLMTSPPVHWVINHRLACNISSSLWWCWTGKLIFILYFSPVCRVSWSDVMPRGPANTGRLRPMCPPQSTAGNWREVGKFDARAPRERGLKSLVMLPQLPHGGERVAPSQPGTSNPQLPSRVTPRRGVFQETLLCMLYAGFTPLCWYEQINVRSGFNVHADTLLKSNVFCFPIREWSSCALCSKFRK